MALAPVLRAQSVHWDPPGGTMAVGQAGALKLVFEGCAPKDNAAPTLPAVDGLALQLAAQGSRSSFSFNAGGPVASTAVELTYATLLSKNQAVTIPAFVVETDKGRVTVPAANFSPTTATVGGGRPGNAAPAAGGVSLDSVAQSHFTTPRAVWAGEVFPLGYTLDILQRYASDLAGHPEWNPAPLIVEDDWSKNNSPEVTRPARNGEQWVSITYRTRAYAKTPGEPPLGPLRQIVTLQTGNQGFGLFSFPTGSNYAITTAPASLTVKPLPLPAPANFSGAVGDFRLAAKVVPATAAVGEPVTWTVTLEGAGNWPDLAGLPPRDVSRDFRTVSPQAKRTYAEGKLFNATLAEDIVLIPTKPGTYTLGPVMIACFDPKSGQYKNLTTEKFTVTITGGAPAAANTLPPLPGGYNSATAPPSDNPQSAIQTPPSPSGLPRDPLPPAPPSATPLSARAFVLLLLAPFALLPALWAALALRRAKATDPLRPQREARARLTATLAELRADSSADSPARRDLQPSTFDFRLLCWRRDTATLFGLAHAEPTAADLAPARNQRLPPPLPGEIAPQLGPVELASGISTPALADWQSLWRDTDRALFGEKQSLPTDWLPRAEAALVAKPLPRFQPLRLFLPRNLFPFAALALVFLSPFSPLPPPALAAATPAAVSNNPKSKIGNPNSAAVAYGEGDFPAAEKSWRSALAAAPTDWAAQHNLALALAQQNRWSESAGHALAAFVQQPRNPAVRWQLALALKNAGYLPDAARPFFADDTPGPRAALALRLAPAGWQRAALLAALLAAAALALLLWRAYGAHARWAAPAAWAGLTCAALLGAAAVSSLHLYGPLADARAVLVWRAGVLRSIPTEADTAQKTSPLAPGLVALDDGQPFLGWRHLSFPNGQTGWVRQEELVRLWANF